MVIAVYNLRLVVYHLSKLGQLMSECFQFDDKDLFADLDDKVGELSGVSGVVSFCLFHAASVTG